jgi:hypothetical protein
MRSAIATAEVLLAMRAGEIDFATFEAQVRPELEARAQYFLDKWTGAAYVVDVEDLVQEMLLAAWRSCDAWDPTRLSRKGKPVEITRFVEYQVGRAGEQLCRRACGNPRKGRALPMRRASGESDAMLERVLVAHRHDDMLLDAGRRAGIAVETLSDPIDRTIIESVIAGGSFADIAAELYADLDRRLTLRLDSEAAAKRFVVGRARVLEAVFG